MEGREEGRKKKKKEGERNLLIIIIIIIKEIQFDPRMVGTVTKGSSSLSADPILSG